jgi:hypothetical protein
MDEERTWRVESLWWLSCFLTLMAVLVPVSAGEGIYRAFSSQDPNVDLLNVALGWTILQPVQIVLAFWPFFASGALSARLLVGTFAGVRPRVVTSVFCTGAVAMGVWVTTQDAPTTVVYAGAALVWALVMPLPLKDLLADGSLKGGLIIGLGCAGLLNVWDFALVAIVWCCWRLYRDNYVDVPITAGLVAAEPLLMVVDDPSGALSTTGGLYTTLETALLLILAMAAIALGQLFPDPDEGAEETDAR